MGSLAFRDAVIAGLRSRGWPEHGLDDNDCVVWRDDVGGYVLLEWGEDRVGFNYEAADGEGGYISFGEGASPERVVEAIDRLRWVIGLPERVGSVAGACWVGLGCLPPLIPPEGVVEALAEAHALMGPEIDDLLRRTGDRDAKAEYRHALRPGMDTDGPRWIGE